MQTLKKDLLLIFIHANYSPEIESLFGQSTGLIEAYELQFTSDVNSRRADTINRFLLEAILGIYCAYGHSGW